MAKKPEGPREWSPRKTGIEKFIEDQGITMEWAPIPMNPNLEDDEPDIQGRRWADEAFHYKVVFKKGSKRLVSYFSMGAGLPDPPEVSEVLDSLASDAAGYENNPDFDGWVREYGLDADEEDEDPYRKHRKGFKLVKQQAEKLKKFLGDQAYEELLWNIERE